MARDVGTTLRHLGMGALALLCLGALAIAGLLVVAWIQVGSEELVSAELEEAVSAIAGEVHVSLAGDPSAPTRRVRVLIDAKDADVVISPGAAGTAFEVDATYDDRYFALEQRPSPEDHVPPVWHLWFRRVGGSGQVMHLLRGLLGATRPQLQVRLPRDQWLELHLNTSSGLTQVELGGLQITELYAELSTGGLSVNVDSPLEPLERFKIDSRQSTIAVRSLGNASPRNVVIDCTMGGAEIDLRGDWRTDAEVLLETKMAGGTLWLPKEVDIEGLEDRWTSSRAEIPRPTLRFEVESDIGGLKIQH